MEYAPVLIPTLNRYQHLKRLIESLQKNKWAKYTTLVISVDYPPNEKWVEGYKKVREYLKSPIEGFRNVEIYYQEKNLGSYGNANFLMEKIEDEYESFIFLEDDNEVSINFIEYMDKGLNSIKGKKNIYGICANNEVIITKQVKRHNISNGVRMLRYMTYGLAMPIERRWEVLKKCDEDYFIKLAYHPIKCFKLFCKDKHLYCRWVGDILYPKEVAYYKNKVHPIDIVFDIAMALEDKYMIVPNISKIRNYGFDGSGALSNGKETETLWSAFEQWIDDSESFEYPNIEDLDIADDEAKMIDKKSRPDKVTIIICIILHFMFCVGRSKSVALLNLIKNI